MEILRIKIQKAEVNVLFTGEKYIFINSYFGVIAIATRDYSNYDDNTANFTIMIGNSYCVGSSFEAAILPAVKRLINREESKYLSKKVTHKVENFDLNRGNLEIDFVVR